MLKRKIRKLQRMLPIVRWKRLQTFKLLWALLATGQFLQIESAHQPDTYLCMLPVAAFFSILRKLSKVPMSHITHHRSRVVFNALECLRFRIFFKNDFQSRLLQSRFSQKNWKGTTENEFGPLDRRSRFYSEPIRHFSTRKPGEKPGKSGWKSKAALSKGLVFGCLLSFLSAAKPKPAVFRPVWFFRQMSYRFAVTVYAVHKEPTVTAIGFAV